MSGNPLKELAILGQSLWLDYIRRDLIAGGELRRLIEEDGLRGMTSNPSIFERAIADSHDYDDDMNVICLGGHVVGNAVAWELVRTFLQARFSGAERHRRRLAKIASLESKEAES